MLTSFRNRCYRYLFPFFVILLVVIVILPVIVVVVVVNVNVVVLNSVDGYFIVVVVT